MAVRGSSILLSANWLSTRIEHCPDQKDKKMIVISSYMTAVLMCVVTMLAECRPIKDCIDLAVRGATLSVQRPGATDSVPYRHEFLIQPSDGVQIEPE
jgi:hypothetical protein